MGKTIALWLIVLSLLFPARQAFAAIGCTLTNPALDLKYVYPAMTSYKEDVYSFSSLGDPSGTFTTFEFRLQAPLDPIFDALQTPFTVYSIFQGDDLIGIVHGVNVPARGGVIQLFLSIDPKNRTIRELFFQRLESDAAKLFRNKSFRQQFAGLSLADWYMSDYFEKADPTNERSIPKKVPPPSGLSDSSLQDYHAIMTGVRKNLVLLDLFLFQRASDQYFERAQERITRLRSERSTEKTQ